MPEEVRTFINKLFKETVKEFHFTPTKKEYRLISSKLHPTIPDLQAQDFTMQRILNHLSDKFDLGFEQISLEQMHSEKIYQNSANLIKGHEKHQEILDYVKELSKEVNKHASENDDTEAIKNSSDTLLWLIDPIYWE